MWFREQLNMLWLLRHTISNWLRGRTGHNVKLLYHVGIWCHTFSMTGEWQWALQIQTLSITQKVLKGTLFQTKLGTLIPILQILGHDCKILHINYFCESIKVQVFTAKQSRCCLAMRILTLLQIEGCHSNLYHLFISTCPLEVFCRARLGFWLQSIVSLFTLSPPGTLHASVP